MARSWATNENEVEDESTKGTDKAEEETFKESLQAAPPANDDPKHTEGGVEEGAAATREEASGSSTAPSRPERQETDGAVDANDEDDKKDEDGYISESTQALQGRDAPTGAEYEGAAGAAQTPPAGPEDEGYYDEEVEEDTHWEYKGKHAVHEDDPDCPTENLQFATYGEILLDDEYGQCKFVKRVDAETFRVTPMTTKDDDSSSMERPAHLLRKPSPSESPASRPADESGKVPDPDGKSPPNIIDVEAEDPQMVEDTAVEGVKTRASGAHAFSEMGSTRLKNEKDQHFVDEISGVIYNVAEGSMTKPTGRYNEKGVCVEDFTSAPRLHGFGFVTEEQDAVDDGASTISSQHELNRLQRLSSVTKVASIILEEENNYLLHEAVKNWTRNDKETDIAKYSNYFFDGVGSTADSQHSANKQEKLETRFWFALVPNPKRETPIKPEERYVMETDDAGLPEPVVFLFHKIQLRGTRKVRAKNNIQPIEFERGKVVIAADKNVYVIIGFVKIDVHSHPNDSTDNWVDRIPAHLVPFATPGDPPMVLIWRAGLDGKAETLGKHFHFSRPDDLLGAADFQNTGAKTYLLQKYNENRTRLVELFTGSLSIYPNTWTKPKKGEAGEIPSIVMDTEVFKFGRVQPIEAQQDLQRDLTFAMADPMASSSEDAVTAAIAATAKSDMSDEQRQRQPRRPEQVDNWNSFCQKTNKQCGTFIEKLEKWINNPPTDSNSFLRKKADLVKEAHANKEKWAPWGTGFAADGSISRSGMALHQVPKVNELLEQLESMPAPSKQASVKGGKKPRTGAGATAPADQAEGFLRQTEGTALYAEGLNQIKELQTENHELLKQLRERPTQRELEDLRKVASHLEEEQAKFKAEKDKWVKERAKFEVDQVVLRTTVEKQTKDMADFGASCDKLLSENAALKKEVKDLQAKTTQLNHEKVELDKKLAVLEEKERVKQTYDEKLEGTKQELYDTKTEKGKLEAKESVRVEYDQKLTKTQADTEELNLLKAKEHIYNQQMQLAALGTTDKKRKRKSGERKRKKTRSSSPSSYSNSDDSGSEQSSYSASSEHKKKKKEKKKKSKKGHDHKKAKKGRFEITNAGGPAHPGRLEITHVGGPSAYHAHRHEQPSYAPWNNGDGHEPWDSYGGHEQPYGQWSAEPAHGPPYPYPPHQAPRGGWQTRRY